MSAQDEEEITEEGERAIKSVAKGAGIVFIGVVFSRFAGYLYRVIVARHLGTEAYGIISLAMSLIGFALPICLLGLNHGIKRYASFYRGKDEYSKVKGTIFSSVKITTSASIIVSVSLFLLSDFFAFTVFKEPSASVIFKIFSLALFFRALASIFVSATDSFQEMKYRSLSHYIFKGITKLTTVLLFFYIGYELVGAAYAYLLSYVVAFGASLYFLRSKILPKIRDSVPVDNYEELLSYSWPLLFVSLMGSVLASTDRIMLGYFSTASDVGIYNAALPTAMLLGTALYSMRIIILPVFSDLLGKDKKKEMKQAYRTTTKWLFTTTLPLFVVLVLFAPQVLRLLFGADYTAGATALSILSLAYFSKVCLGISSPALKTMEKTKLILYGTAFAAFVNIVLNYFLIQKHGINGAALAYLISISLMYLLYTIWSHRYLKTNPFKLSLYKPIVATVVSTLITYFIFRRNLSITTWMLPIAFLFFMGIYVLLFLVLGGIESEDLLILKAIEKKSGMRIKWLRNLIKKFI